MIRDEGEKRTMPSAANLRRLLTAALMCTSTAAYADGERALALLSAEPTDSGVTLIAKVSALTSGQFDARMVVSKDGSAGSANTAQSGSYELSAGDTATVARLGLSLDPADRLEVKFTVKSAGATVATSSLSIGSD